MEENKKRIFEMTGNKGYKIKLIYQEGIFLTELEKEIINDEDIILVAYKDTKGILTIGAGHTAGVEEEQEIDLQTAIKLLRQDIAEAKKKLFKPVYSFSNFK